MKRSNSNKSIADKVGDKEMSNQPSTLKNIPSPTLEEVVEKKKSQPISTNPIGNGMEYYWDNTFMVFVEPEVRKQRIVSSDIEPTEEINVATPTR
jgi:2-hydroxy-3-keto-5-methylthiopentenyl-1-phosphate phosphatase